MGKAPTSPGDYIASVEEPSRTEAGEASRVIRKTRPDLEPHLQPGLIG
jgi:hypothetical protein